jgi:hypothetical protein
MGRGGGEFDIGNTASYMLHDIWKDTGSVFLNKNSSRKLFTDYVMPDKFAFLLDTALTHDKNIHPSGSQIRVDANMRRHNINK